MFFSFFLLIFRLFARVIERGSKQLLPPICLTYLKKIYINNQPKCIISIYVLSTYFVVYFQQDVTNAWCENSPRTLRNLGCRKRNMESCSHILRSRHTFEIKQLIIRILKITLYQILYYLALSERYHGLTMEWIYASLFIFKLFLSSTDGSTISKRENCLFNISSSILTTSFFSDGTI